MSKVVRVYIPKFLNPFLHERRGTTTDFLRESLQMFLEQFEDGIKQNGMHEMKNVGIRFNEEELEAIGSDVRLPQALRMAVIWRLGVEYGKKN